MQEKFTLDVIIIKFCLIKIILIIFHFAIDNVASFDYVVIMRLKNRGVRDTEEIKMEEVKFFDAVKSEYKLTNNHAASSYNQPVLVDRAGMAFGPNDQIRDRYGDWRTVHQWMADSLFLVDPAQQDCDTIKAFNRLIKYSSHEMP